MSYIRVLVKCWGLLIRNGRYRLGLGGEGRVRGLGRVEWSRRQVMNRATWKG